MNATLLLVARRARERSEALAPLLRRIQQTFPLESPPEVELHYRASTDTLAVVVRSEAGSVDWQVLSERLRSSADSELRLRVLRPDPEELTSLLAGFDVHIDDVLDPISAVAALEIALRDVPSLQRRVGRRFTGEGVAARLEWGEDVREAWVADLSLAGAFLEMSPPYPDVGTLFQVNLEAGGQETRTESRVVFHLSPERAATFDRQAGIGVHFVTSQPEATAAFADFVDHVAAQAAARESRRTSARHPVRLSISLRTPEEVREVLADNLSTGGIFLASDTPPPIGQEVELSLDLPGSQASLILHAVVRHTVYPSEAGSGRPVGAGLQFLDPPPEITEHLAGWLEALEARRLRRILVADDTQFFRTVLADLLTSAGYDVLQASSGDEALRMVMDELLTLDLLILDIHMPGLNGVEVIDRLRRLGGETELPVLVLSGAVDDPTEQRLIRELGATEFLTKDTSLTDVLSTVDATLRIG